jgi:hypothetical protein
LVGWGWDAGGYTSISLTKIEGLKLSPTFKDKVQ